MAFKARLRVLSIVFLLLVACGCAYEISRTQSVTRPGKIRTLNRIVVAPFRYANDWTGLFRDIYEKAGLKAPEVKKIEFLEGAFLVRDAVTAKGYEVLRWPKELANTKADDLWSAEGGIAEAHLPLLRDSGAQALILAGGSRNCNDIELCAAKVEIRLVDLVSQEELWKSGAGATTAFSQGDEMRAAVREALGGFPVNRPVRGESGKLRPL